MNNNRVWTTPAVQALMAFNGCTDPIKAIQIEAQTLLIKANITKPPVWVRSLKPFCGVKNITAAKMDQDAVLISRQDGFFIIVNEDHSPAKQRFSCAHEIGHILLLRYNDQKTIESKIEHHIGLNLGNTGEEYLCDQAASEILMPNSFFKPLAEKCDHAITSLPTLAKAFWTSIESTAFRLIQTNIWKNCVIVVWKFQNKPNSTVKKLRVHWSLCSNNAEYFIPKYTSMTKKSSIFNTYQTGKIHAGKETLELGSLKGNYYVESAKFGNNHKEYEYVLSIIFLESPS